MSTSRPLLSGRSGIDAGLAGPTYDVGSGIRAIRKRAGLSIKELADAAGLTPSAISMIERGASDPSLAALRRISSALDVQMSDFLRDPPRSGIVVRRHERTRLRFPAERLEYEIVSALGAGELEVLSVTLRPGAETHATQHAHEPVECTTVIHGRVMVEVDGIATELEVGDSVTIRAHVPHRFWNVGEEDAEILMALSLPMV